MQPSVFTKSLADHRRGLAAWAGGSALIGMMYAGFYPQIRGDAAEAMAGFPEAMREAFGMDDLASAAGYLQSSVFGVILPVIAMIYGIVVGARAVAGEEESGELDVVLAHPVTRIRFMAHRFGALVVGAFAIAAVVWVAMLAIRGGAELTEITPVQFLAQAFNLALLTVFFGALTAGVGAATGRRGVAVGTAAAVGVLGYAMHTFGSQAGLDWAADVSPFAFYIAGEPLRNGFQWGDAAVLAVAALVLIGLGALRFDRRDINS